MKKILSLLLMTIPILLGSCQDNDVQDVSFETELINVDAYTRLTDYTVLTYFNVYGDQT